MEKLATEVRETIVQKLVDTWSGGGEIDEGAYRDLWTCAQVNGNCPKPFKFHLTNRH